MLNKVASQMKPTIDFARVEEHQLPIHDRLRNWARWVVVRPQSRVHVMFKNYRSHAWQWYTPEIRETCDLIDAQALEKVVGTLPPKHRAAVRWAYVYRASPAIAVRELGLTYEGLYRHVRDGRQMLLNLVG